MGRDPPDQARLGQLAEEQAALRRVATLVAQATPPEQVFAAVAEEVGQLFRVELATLCRYEPGRMWTPVTTWGPAGKNLPVGVRWPLEGHNVSTLVFETGRPARIDRYAGSSSGPVSAAPREIGIRSAVGTPVLVEGRLWGVIFAGSTLEQPLPAGTETRLASFTELVATAIANADSRAALARLAEEQAALRRVATLVAQATPPQEVFAAAAGEVGRLPGRRLRDPGPLRPPGHTRGSRRLDQNGRPGADPARRPAPARRPERDHAGVPHRPASPDRLQRRLRRNRPGRLPRLGATLLDRRARPRREPAVGLHSRGVQRPGAAAAAGHTEAQLASFTELLATAIANAESRSELAASRRRIVAASDETRRRIERDLHDGTQQRLVSLALAARTAEADVAAGRGDPRAGLSRIAAGLADAVAELQELSRGIHPAVLSEHGLGPALRTLARRSAVPVDLDITTNARCPEPIEIAAYYVTSEALANTMKHAQASHAEISLSTRNGSLLLSIRDDGVGGADPARGSGLAGLTDRVEALGGSIHLHSTAGAGTHITVDLPLAHELAQRAG